MSPGSTINEYNTKIRKFIIANNPCVISVNFIPENMRSHYHFFSNIKRFQQSNASEDNIIISSNLKNEILECQYIFDFKRLVYFDNIFSENSTLMILNLLMKMNIDKEIYCAGFDGFKNDNNFYRSIYERKVDCEKENSQVLKIIDKLREKLCLKTITPTIYGLEIY